MANSRLADTCAWCVISDPLEEGGFEPGVRFSTQEIVFMLKYQSLTRGSILQHKHLGEFTVISSSKTRFPFSMVNRKYIAAVSNQNLRITPN